MNNLNIPIYRAKVLGLDNNYIIGFYQQYIDGRSTQCMSCVSKNNGRKKNASIV